METTSGKDAEGGGAVSVLDRRQAPLLLFDYGREMTARQGVDFIFYSIPTKQMQLAKAEGVRDHRYWTTPQGWMLMAAPAGSLDTFLWNPFTGRRIDLPPDSEGFLSGDDCKMRCLLSSSTPADPGCLVLVADFTDTVLWHCRPGGKRWLRHQYDPSTLGDTTRDAFLRSMSTLTSVDGKFFISSCDEVVTLELLPGPVFSVLPVDEDRSVSPPYTCSATKLVESGGDLFRVRFSFSDINSRFISSIGVFKLNLSGRAWVKVVSLDGRAFVVHPCIHGSFDPQEVGLKGDCIYYCRPHDKALHVYNIERGTTTLHNPAGCFFANKVLMPTR